MTNLKKEIQEELEKAEKCLTEIPPGAHNSYGAGYDRGQVDAFEQVLSLIDEIDEKKNDFNS